MPGFFHEPTDRKDFLQRSGAIAASLLTATQVTSSPANAAEDSSVSSKTAHIALLSDTHIPEDTSNEYRGFRPVDNLKTVVSQVVTAAPQAAIINGDAARLTGEPGDYMALKKLLQPIAEKSPVHIGLGNHDDRENFFRIFPGAKQPVLADKHVSIFEMAGTRFVVLDSLLYVDKVAGLLGKSQRDWLAKYLEGDDKRPIVFFVHHTLDDGDGSLLDFGRVFAIMKQHRHVKAIFYGHSHRYHVEQREHIYLINQPAIGYNFNDGQPVGWLDAHFNDKGVSMKLHAIGGNVDGHGKTQTIEWS